MIVDPADNAPDELDTNPTVQLARAAAACDEPVNETLDTDGSIVYGNDKSESFNRSPSVQPPDTCRSDQRELECPRFGGQLSAWSALSGWAGRMRAMPRGSNFQKPYPSEFRREAVELVRRSGRPLRETAVDLGISTETLRMWVRQADVDGGRREGLTSAERTELRELRRKVKTLEQEREILKKAAVFFARESETR